MPVPLPCEASAPVRPGWSPGARRRAGDVRALLTREGTPDIVLIFLGGNDAARTRAAYRWQLEWVVRQARSAGARRIVWFGPATSDPGASPRAARTSVRHERNAEWQREILPELGVEWIDSRPMTRRGHGRDGVHFTRSGYRLWADGIVGAQRSLAVAASPSWPGSASRSASRT